MDGRRHFLLIHEALFLRRTPESYTLFLGFQENSAGGALPGGRLLFLLDTLLRSFYSARGTFLTGFLKIFKINIEGG